MKNPYNILPLSNATRCDRIVSSIVKPGDLFYFEHNRTYLYMVLDLFFVDNLKIVLTVFEPKTLRYGWDSCTLDANIKETQEQAIQRMIRPYNWLYQ